MPVVQPRRIDDEALIRGDEDEVCVVPGSDLAFARNVSESRGPFRHPAHNLY